MALREKIIKHNNPNFNYNLTGELIRLATDPNTFETKMVRREIKWREHTYIRWRPEFAQGKTEEERLARNIRIWIVRYTRKAYSIRDKSSFQGTNSEIADYDSLDHIYSTFTELGFHYHQDDFLSVPQSVWDKIEEVHGWDYADDLKAEFEHFCLPLHYIKKQKARLQAEYVPLIREALEEVLPKVDLKKPIDEIIAFIAKSAKRSLDRKLTKYLKTKVHHTNGEAYYVTQEQIMQNQFVYTKAEEVLSVSPSNLRNGQYDFFMKLKGMVEEEAKSRNTAPFRFDKEGKAVGINKRFFAQKMEMEESAFKKRLSRIQTNN